MAAPSFVQAGTGATDATGDWAFVSNFASNSVVGNIAIVQILQDGSTSGAVATSSFTNVANLAGTGSSMDYIGAFAVGGSSQAIQHLWIGRITSAAGSKQIAGTNSTSEDLYARWYEFTNGSTGTTLATVIENSTAGSTANGVGTSATVSDAGVTTLGPDRLALNLVAGNDDNPLDAFTGMTGGTWAEAVAEYAESSGTDGVIQLQTATLASAGTINGGSDGWADATDGWGVVGFALIGTTPTGGASIVPLTLALTLVGKIAARGASVISLALSLTTQGRRTTFGSASLPLAASFTTSGSISRLGSAALPLSLSLTSSGTRTALGQSTLPLTLGLVSTGDISGGETLFGSAVLPLSLDRVTQGRVTVFAHPLLDSVDGTWTDYLGGTDLANQLDEHVASDVDYIRSELHPETSACRMKLEALVNPDQSGPHELDWRIAKDAGGGNTVDMQIRLYNGGGDSLGAGTLIATRSRSDVSETFTTYHEALTAGEVALITDYATLFLELEATVAA